MELTEQSFDPGSPALAADFWPTLKAMQTGCPVLHSNAAEGFWVLTRYEDVWRCAHDTNKTFTTTPGVSPFPRADAPRLLPIMADGQLHRDLRKIMDPWFSPRSIAPYEAAIRQQTGALLDEITPSGRTEFMAEVAIPLPGRLFFELVIGAPPDQRDVVADWAAAVIFEPARAAAALRDLLAWSFSFAEQRRSAPPRGDVVDALLQGQTEGRLLSDQEIAESIVNLVLGGVETTGVALGNIMVHLARDAAVRSVFEEDCEVRSAIDELLRFEAPVPAFSRTATADGTFGGERIATGERVLMYYGAANRDPEEFEAPDELVLDRGVNGTNRHLSFGAGPHRCPGAHLARLVLRIVIDEVVGRWADIEIELDEITYRPGTSHGPVLLPLRFRPRDAAPASQG